MKFLRLFPRYWRAQEDADDSFGKSAAADTDDNNSQTPTVGSPTQSSTGDATTGTADDDDHSGVRASTPAAAAIGTDLRRGGEALISYQSTPATGGRSIVVTAYVRGAKILNSLGPAARRFLTRPKLPPPRPTAVACGDGSVQVSVGGQTQTPVG